MHKPRLHEQSFRQNLGKSFFYGKFARRKLCQGYPVYTIKVFISSYLSSVNSKINKMAELDFDSEKMF